MTDPSRFEQVLLRSLFYQDLGFSHALHVLESRHPPSDSRSLLLIPRLSLPASPPERERAKESERAREQERENERERESERGIASKRASERKRERERFLTLSVGEQQSPGIDG